MGNGATKVGLAPAYEIDEKVKGNSVIEDVSVTSKTTIRQKVIIPPKFTAIFRCEDVRVMINSPVLFNILIDAIANELMDPSLKCIGTFRDGDNEADGETGSDSANPKTPENETGVPNNLAAKLRLLKIMTRYFKDYENHFTKLVAMKVISDRIQSCDGFWNAFSSEYPRLTKTGERSPSDIALQDLPQYGKLAQGFAKMDTSLCSNTSVSHSRRSLFSMSDHVEKRNSEHSSGRISGVNSIFRSSKSVSPMRSLEKTPAKSRPETVADAVLSTLKTSPHILKELYGISWVRLLCMAFDSLPLGITLITTSSRKPKQQFEIMYSNRIFRQLARCQKKETAGLRLKDFHGPNTDPRHIVHLNSALLVGEPAYIPEMVSRAADGTSFEETVIIRPLHDQGGRYRYSVVIHVSHQYIHFPLMLQFANELADLLPKTIIEY
jgi:hypothetical protein